MAGFNNAQTGRQISAGIGSFFGNDKARQSGELAGLQQVMLEDQIGQRREAAELARAKGQREADAALLAAPGAAIGRALTAFGQPTSAAADVAEFFRTGAMPTRAAEPLAEGLQGPEAPPQPKINISPDVLRDIGQFFAADQAVQAGSAKSAKDFFEALRVQPSGNLAARIASGELTPSVGGARTAAIEGKPLFNFNEFGVGDNFAGTVDASNPAAQRFGQYRQAQTGAQRANAAQSYAAADNSRASAAKTRAEAADGVNRGGSKAPTGYRWAGDGALEPIPGGPADPATKGAKLAKPPTEGQAKALLFGSRMQIADDALRELEGRGSLTPSYAKQAADAVPTWAGGRLLSAGANTFASADEQQVEQAQRDFINAVLRRESGAAIGKDEFTNAQQQYFPQPGDSAAVRRQKAINRQTAIAGMKTEFGEQGLPDFDRIVGDARAARAPATPASRRSSGTVGAAGADQPVAITTDAEYAALPPGTRFRTPDGKMGTKR
jgi:hypothetical protein